MKYQYWLAVGAVSMLLVMLIVIAVLEKKERKLSIWLKMELIVVFINSLLDLVTAMIFTHGFVVNRVLFYLIANVYYASLFIYPTIFLIYIVRCCRQHVSKLALLPSLINIILLCCVNPFVPIYFEYTTVYTLKPLIVLVYLNWIFYISLVCFIANRNKIILGNIRHQTLNICIILGFSGIIIQWIFSNVLVVSFMLAIATIMITTIYCYIDNSVDDLTGIPTRKSFIRETTAMINKNNDKYYLVRFDICEFKMINEIYGYDFGDELLITIAKSMVKKLGKIGTYEEFRQITLSFVSNKISFH